MHVSAPTMVRSCDIPEGIYIYISSRVVHDWSDVVALFWLDRPIAFSPLEPWALGLQLSDCDWSTDWLSNAAVEFGTPSCLSQFLALRFTIWLVYFIFGSRRCCLLGQTGPPNTPALPTRQSPPLRVLISKPRIFHLFRSIDMYTTDCLT